MQIRTNKLDIKIDFEKLSNTFDFFKIETSDKYIKSGSYILDVPEIDKNIKAVYYKTGKCFFVLMKKDDDNFYRLRKTIDASELSDTLTIKEMSVDGIDPCIIAQLLLNALGSYDNKFLKANNLTGHFYVFNPNWSIWGKHKGNSFIKQVICMEVDITGEGYIKLPVKTFTNVRFKGQITFRKKAYQDYPKYVYAANNTLRRKLKEDDEEIFILRQIDHKKSDIVFLDISDIDSFEASKMGMLQKTLRLFNDTYIGMAALNLASEEINDLVDYDTNQKKREEKIRIDDLRDFSVKIIDEVGNELSERFSKDIAQLIIDTYDKEDKYGLKVSIGKRADKEALNIAVIHNKQYYIDTLDVHDKTYIGAVQHITLEDFLGDSKAAAIKTVINEALIKRDLKKEKISLFPWSEYGFKNDMYFGIRVKDDDSVDRYYFMKVDSDGNISVKEQELNLFEMTEYYDLVEIYESDNSSESILGIIKDDQGNVNIIRDTGMFTVPEIDLLTDELVSGNNELRGKEARNKYLASILDIKSFMKDGELYYFSGTIGNGMRTKVENSSNIRKIEAYKSSKLIFDKMLPLMNTTFVKNGQLTVVPFPFKYLREYILVNDLL